MRIDFFGNIDRLRLPFHQITGHTKATESGSKISATPKINGEFLKGPIPLVWLSAAAGLPGKASLAVGLAIWFESGRRKSHEIVLTTAILERFNVNRKSKYRGLKALEAVGLISVLRRPKKNPVVTIETTPNQSSGTTAANGGTDVSTNNSNPKWEENMNDEYESDIDKLCSEITSLCDEINAACNDDDLEIPGIRQVSPDEFEPLHDCWHNYSGNLRTLNIRNLLESRGLRIDSQIGNKLRAECPWANEHSSGDDRASFLTADEDRGLFPTFHCFHRHCRGRTIQDVLELFSAETVEGFCSQNMGRAV